MIMLVIRDMLQIEIDAVARIHHEAFQNDCETYERSCQWIRCKYLGWPVNRYFTAISREEVIGYILWVEMGGLRKESILELEQLAVARVCRSRKVGTQLIDESLLMIASMLEHQGRRIRLVEVTTGAMNEVKNLYKKTLGAEVKCKKRKFFDEDEIVMIARHSAINSARVKRGLLPLHEARMVE